MTKKLNLDSNDWVWFQLLNFDWQAQFWLILVPVAQFWLKGSIVQFWLNYSISIDVDSNCSILSKKLNIDRIFNFDWLWFQLFNFSEKLKIYSKDWLRFQLLNSPRSSISIDFGYNCSILTEELNYYSSHSCWFKLLNLDWKTQYRLILVPFA